MKRKGVLALVVVLAICFAAPAAHAKIVMKEIKNSRGTVIARHTYSVPDDSEAATTIPPEVLAKSGGVSGWKDVVLKIEDEDDLPTDGPARQRIVHWSESDMETNHRLCIEAYGTKKQFFNKEPDGRHTKFRPGMWNAIVVEMVAKVYKGDLDSLYRAAAYGGIAEKKAYYDKLIELSARMLGYIEAESSGYPCSTSGAGARGLGQVMSSTWTSVCKKTDFPYLYVGNVPKAYDPRSTVECALREILDKEIYFVNRKTDGHVTIKVNGTNRTLDLRQDLHLDPTKPDVFYQAGVYNAGKLGWIYWLASRAAEFDGKTFDWLTPKMRWSREKLLRHQDHYLGRIISTTNQHMSQTAWFTNLLRQTPGWKIIS